MRAYLFLWVAALAVSAVLAAPTPPLPAPVKDRKELRNASRYFAQQMRTLIEQIVEHYVRPVSREDLLETALVGLYQAARKPVPRDLHAQVRQASSMAMVLQTRNPEALMAERPVQDPLERLLASLRENLGTPEALAGQDCVLICCKALARRLDQHSGIITAEEQRRAMGQDQECSGLGLEIHDRLGVGPLVVEAVQLGSPAQRAGIRPGDVITHVDGTAIADAPPEKLALLCNRRPTMETVPAPLPPDEKEPVPTPQPRRTIQLGYHRPRETTQRQATLLRERFRPETVLGVKRRDDNGWSYWLDEKQKTAMVRVTTLSRGTGEDLRTVLMGLKDAKMRGLVLDLRWCPGGYLNEAVEVADLFLGTALIATVKSRGREDVPYRSAAFNKFIDFAVVVLVNAETSGGAELIAAALQDHRRAVIVGQRTRGKASVQTPLSIGIEGVGFKLTSGTFHRPSGQNLHRFPDSKSSDDWGVIPDEDCRLSSDMGNRLRQWWDLYSLRPVNSRERLMLDDPRADPQRLAAEHALRKRLELAAGNGKR